MNKLSNCELFNAYKSFKPDILKMLNPQTFSKYEIPSAFYENWYNTLMTKKYPLVRPTLKAAKNGLIHFFNFADPIDSSAKPVIIHPSLSAFLGMNNKKEVVSFVNVADKSNIIRDADKEPVGIKIDENHLYGYLQTGYTAILLNKKDTEITNNIKLQTDMAEIYATLLAHVIDSIYPISSEDDGYQRLTFLCAMFYLQFMAEYSEEKALSVALKLKTVDQVVIASKCKSLAFGNVKMNSFDDFLAALKVEYPFINLKDFGLREISMGFKKRYGPASFFAVEHFQTLLNFVQHVGLRTNLYADYNLSRMIPPTLIADVNKILLLISGE